MRARTHTTRPRYDFVKTTEMNDKDYIHERLLFASGRAMEAVFNTTFTTVQ